MGTRNLTLVLLNGEYKVAQYGQWDGYPSGQGLVVLNFLRTMEIDKMRTALDHVKFPTDEEAKQLTDKVDTQGKIDGVDWLEIYPQFSRDICAKILELVYTNKEEVLLLKNSLNFAADSLFCEWAYLVNLDNDTLEVYKGFNKSRLNEFDRFLFLEEKAEDDYHPIKIVKSYLLSALPTDEDFVSELTGKDSDE
jgi:hypothetical protein